ncbi:hypothetical protein Ancab_009068 [Ancistrocladus abbreviatus]
MTHCFRFCISSSCFYFIIAKKSTPVNCLKNPLQTCSPLNFHTVSLPPSPPSLSPSLFPFLVFSAVGDRRSLISCCRFPSGFFVKIWHTEPGQSLSMKGLFISHLFELQNWKRKKEELGVGYRFWVCQKEDQQKENFRIKN